MVDVGRPAAVNGVADGGVFGQLVLQVHHRLGAPDEQDGVAVVQPTHLIWGQQFPAAHLKISRVRAGFALGLTVGFRIDCGFPKGIGDVLVGGRFIAAQVQNCVTIARNCLPTILIKFLDLCMR